MAKLIISDILSGYFSTSALNAAFTAIEAAIENTLSRDGTTPNQMTANLDMNSNRITNLPEPVNVNEAARLQDVQNAIAGSTTANLITATATTNNSGTTVQEQLNNLGNSTGAASIGNVPAGNISATTVQAAINELDTEKQPLDAELTAIAGLTSAANKVPRFTGSGTAEVVDIVSGTYSPTFTLGTNVSGASLGGFPLMYTRVGNIVSISGRVYISTTSTGLSTLSMSLPVASDFADSFDVAGFGFRGSNEVVSCSASTTVNLISLTFTSTSTASISTNIQLTYEVI